MYSLKQTKLLGQHLMFSGRCYGHSTTAGFPHHAHRLSKLTRGQAIVQARIYLQSC